MATPTGLAARAVRARRAGFAADLVSVAGRAIRRLPREPEVVIPALIVPVFFYFVTIGALAWAQILVNMSHFMASYRIVYRDRAMILKHRWATIGVPLILFLYILVAIEQARTGTAILVGLLVAVSSGYLAWHYTGQVWGMMASFSWLGGVRFEPGERRLIRASLRILLGWHVVWAAHIWLGQTSLGEPPWMQTLYRVASVVALSALGVGVRAGGGDLAAFALLSPLSGTVLERTAVQGQMADPDRPLFRIADLSRLWLVVQSPERDAVRVRTDVTAEITLAAIPGRKFRGRVDWVGREVDPGVGATAQDAKKAAPKTASVCKGLEEKLCKGKTAECAWIVPKKGKQKAYCRLKPISKAKS